MAAVLISLVKSRAGRQTVQRKKVGAIFLCSFYLTGLAGLTFFNREQGSRNGLSLLPFETWRFQLRAVMFEVENVLLFVPAGILLPMVFPGTDRWKRMALLAGLMTLCIETTQLITGRGYFQVDDLINNFLGGILGYALLEICRRKSKLIHGTKCRCVWQKKKPGRAAVQAFYITDCLLPRHPDHHPEVLPRTLLPWRALQEQSQLYVPHGV